MIHLQVKGEGWWGEEQEPSLPGKTQFSSNGKLNSHRVTNPFFKKRQNWENVPKEEYRKEQRGTGPGSESPAPRSWRLAPGHSLLRLWTLLDIQKLEGIPAAYRERE